MVVISWSDHREKWRGTEFSNGTSPKSGAPRSRATVVGELRHPNRNGVQARFLVAFAQVCTMRKTPEKPFPVPVGGAARRW